MASSWKSLAEVPPFTPGTLLSLTDGSVMLHASGGADWYRLEPGALGHYDEGARWFGPLPMRHARGLFAAGVLRDGRLFVVGGQLSSSDEDTPGGEVFDPRNQVWNPLPMPESVAFIRDAVSGCILADGRVLFGAAASPRCAVWDPLADRWSEAGRAQCTLETTTKSACSGAQSWSLLPDGTVLSLTGAPPLLAEKYDPAKDRWTRVDQLSAAPAVPVGTVGPALLLATGELFCIGAGGHTALYRPPGLAARAGRWRAGPALPAPGESSLEPSDAGPAPVAATAALLPCGRVLFICGTAFLYDPAANTIAALASQPPAGVASTRPRLMLLPTGHVLLTTQQLGSVSMLIDDVIVGAAKSALKPVITAYPRVMTAGQRHPMSGRRLQGPSRAGGAGGAQTGIHYPVARFTHAESGIVRYFRTVNCTPSGAAAAPGIHGASVEVPASAAPGRYAVRLIANGIASDPVTVHIAWAVPAIGVDLQDDWVFGTVVDSPRLLRMDIFNLGDAELIIGDVARIAGSSCFDVVDPPATPVTIRPAEHAEFTLRFTPVARGVHESATIRIVSNDPLKPRFEVQASGRLGMSAHGSGSVVGQSGRRQVPRAAGRILIPRLLTMVADTGDFGSVCVGGFADESIVLGNAGNRRLAVAAVASSSPEFVVPSVHAYPLIIEPGAWLELPIRFKPSSRGTKAATISILSDDPAGPRNISLSGHAPSGTVAVTGSTYFGAVARGIAQKTVAICNVGDCKLRVSRVDFRGRQRNFKLRDNPFPATLPPGCGLNVVVEYRACCEPESCVLVVESDDPQCPVKMRDVVAYTECTRVDARDLPDHLCANREREQPLSS